MISKSRIMRRGGRGPGWYCLVVLMKGCLVFNLKMVIAVCYSLENTAPDTLFSIINADYIHVKDRVNTEELVLQKLTKFFLLHHTFPFRGISKRFISFTCELQNIYSVGHVQSNG